jgi:hypothetical protein
MSQNALVEWNCGLKIVNSEWLEETENEFLEFQFDLDLEEILSYLEEYPSIEDEGMNLL